MNKFYLLLFSAILMLASSVFSEEYYFKFKISEKKELDAVTKLISIDNVIDNTVYAYANDKELDRFISYGYELEFLPKPSELFEAPMAKSVAGLADWDTYPTYQQYDSMMNQFAADYPLLCQLVVIGTTPDGHELLAVKISDNVTMEEDEPEVFLTSSIHGDETTGFVLMLRLIDHLLSNYATDHSVRDLVDEVELWINPAANPDGTYAGGDHTVNGATRGNSNFIDMNRNFPDPDDGPHPDGNAWQQEVIAMMDFADLHSFNLAMNIHGGAEVVNYPWDTWSRLCADNNWWVSKSHTFADTVQAYSPSGYMDGFNDGITNGYAWYTISGGRQDYMNYYKKCREVTYEISNTKLLPGSQLPAHWDYNKKSFIMYIENSLEGIRGIVTDSTTGLPVFAMIEVVGYDIDIDSSQVVTDPDVGDYHRMILPGTYTIEVTAPGYVTKTVSGISVSTGPATVVDVELAPVSADPVFGFVSHDLSSADPGDSNIPMHITLSNDGGGNAVNTIGTLVTSDPYITINQDTSTYPTIGALGGTAESYTAYNFSISPSCPAQYTATFELQITADGGYFDTLQFDITIGLMVEDFESGDFMVYPWVMSGDADWLIDASDYYEGSYSAVSGNISDNDTTTMAVYLDGGQAGEISFYVKASTENNYDYLRFYIDGIQHGEWDGILGWTYVSFPVSAGSHLYEWSYEKDQSVSEGTDEVWVDFITFPVGTFIDTDFDGVENSIDNCPNVSNASQTNSDADSFGDACDNCPLVTNEAQTDADSDGVGDDCDNCPAIANSTQDDTDADTIGDACDNCPDVSNFSQDDSDTDTIGDVCDNCAAVANTDQADGDSDTVGDVCDNCPSTANPGQEDSNTNGVGDVCDYICGDIDNSKGAPDIGDLVYLVEFMFGTPQGPAPAFFNAADVDSSTEIDIADMVYLVDFMFNSGAGLNCP